VAATDGILKIRRWLPAEPQWLSWRHFASSLLWRKTESRF